MAKRWRKRAGRLAALVIAAGIYTFCIPAAAAEEATGGTANAVTLDIPARSCILVSGDTVLYEENADEPMPPASITKIMTLLLTFEALEAGQISLDQTVSCSDYAASMGGTQIWLEPGEEMALSDIIKATAVNSANDCAMVLAETVAGSEEAFVQKMNERAAELGMENTHFENPTGLDADGHLSTARDIAIMSVELLKHDGVTEYTTIWMDSLRGGETGLTNTNKLVRYYDGCTGLKTGTTDGAGSCLSATASREGLSLIAVSMGSPTSDERFSACRTLLDYGFSAFESYTPQVEAGELPEIRVKNGVEGTVAPVLGEAPALLVAKGKSGDVTRTVSLPEEVEAPVEEGQRLGEITFALDGSQLAAIPITAESAVPKMDFSTAIRMIFSMLFQ